MRILTLVLASAITITACTSGGSDTQSTPLPNPPPPVEQFGLDSRPDNQTCVAPQRPGAVTSVTVEEAFPGVTFSGPTKLLMEPVAEPRWFVLQKSGQIRVFDPDNPVVSNYLDISGVVNAAGEGGLLGMAFHPDYPATPEIFLSYTINNPSAPPAMRSIVSRLILDNVTNPSPRGAGTAFGRQSRARAKASSSAARKPVRSGTCRNVSP